MLLKECMYTDTSAALLFFEESYECCNIMN